MFNATDPATDITGEVEDYVPERFEQLVAEGGPLIGLAIGVAITAVVAVIVTLISSIVLKQVFRRHSTVKRAINRTRLPLFATLLFIGSALSLRFAVDPEIWWVSPVAFGLVVAVVVGIAWWALRVVKIVEAVILSKYVGESELGLEDRRGRRVQTQVELIARILAAVIITLAVAAVLLTIPAVRGLGAGVLASAGVVSVVAGLAMQSTLANVFAGIQLAFTDSIRVGDVVVIEDNFGFVEEITLSAVVIRSWDARRFIYPSAHFVATPFENWTRTGTELLGTVELDLDWRVPMDRVRTRVKRLLENTDLWDGQTLAVQVTEATGGNIEVRVVVSARNSGELFDLRCLIREDLVNYLRTEHPYALPAQRMLYATQQDISQNPESVATGQFGAVDAEQQDDAGSEPAQRTEVADEDGAQYSGEIPADQGLFTGSISAVQRNRDFGGPGEAAYRERKERQQED